MTSASHGLSLKGFRSGLRDGHCNVLRAFKAKICVFRVVCGRVMVIVPMLVQTRKVWAEFFFHIALRYLNALKEDMFAPEIQANFLLNIIIPLPNPSLS